MASNYSQDQYYGEYLRCVESFTRLYNEVPPSFQNYLAHQKQEAMAVKEYQQQETSLSTSAAIKKSYSIKHKKRALVCKADCHSCKTLEKKVFFTRNSKVYHCMAKSQSGSKQARPRKDRNTT